MESISPTIQYFAFAGAKGFSAINHAVLESGSTLLATIIALGTVVVVLKHMDSNPAMAMARYWMVVAVVYLGLHRYTESISIADLNYLENTRYSKIYQLVGSKIGEAEVPKIPYAFQNAVQAMMSKIVERINSNYASHQEVSSGLYELQKQNLFNWTLNGKSLGQTYSDFYYKHYLPHVKEYIQDKHSGKDEVREIISYPNDSVLGWMEGQKDVNPLASDDAALWTNPNENLGLSLKEAMEQYGRQQADLLPPGLSKLKDWKKILIYKIWKSGMEPPEPVEITTRNSADGSFSGRYIKAYGTVASMLVGFFQRIAFDYLPICQAIGIMILFLGFGLMLPFLYWPGFARGWIGAWIISVVFFYSWDVGWAVLDWIDAGGRDAYSMITGKEDLFLFSDLGLSTTLSMARVLVPALMGAAMYGTGIMMAGALQQATSAIESQAKSMMTSMGSSVAGNFMSGIDRKIGTKGSSKPGTAQKP